MSTSVLSQVRTFAQDIEAVRDGKTSHPPAVVSRPQNPPSATPSVPVSSTVSTLSTATSQKPTPTAPIKIATTATRDASYPATIITDKKRAKMNVTAEVSGALSSWWKEKVGNVKKSNKRSYSVPAAAMRKGVIETATSHTGRAATTDHHEIVARLKAEKVKRQEEAKTDTPIVPSTQAKPMTAWDTEKTTDQTERHTPPVIPTTTTTSKTPNLALEAELETVTQNATVKTGRSAMSLSTAQVAFPKIKPSIPERAEASIIEPPVREIPTVNPVTELRTPINPQIPTTLAATKQAVTARKEELQKQAVVDAPKKPTVTIPWNKAPYVAVGALALVVVSSAVLFVMNQERGVSPTVTTLPPPTTLPALSTNSQVEARLEAPNKNALYEAIQNTAGTGDSFFVVTPLAFDTGLPLSSDEILTLINRQFTPDVLSSVTGTILGTYRNEPVIIITTDNEASLRGHLFAWETSLNRDLTPWFGTVVVGSSTDAVRFRDSQSGSRDIRVLTDENNVERVVYGFANSTTVIITSSATAFLNLAETYVQ